ncbi:MAG: FecR domain-containing protein [Deltaproteobacteria bacterium]|nr:FecR domain-containing protein [Deltaproteobacteria bacterium]
MKKKIFILSLVFLGYSTQGYTTPAIGKAIEINGKPDELKYARQMATGQLKVDTPLYYNDEVFTGPKSTTRLVVDDFTANIKAAFYVYEDSKFTLAKEVVEATGKKIVVRHTKGVLNSVIKGLQNDDELQIETPYGTVGVRGTCVQTKVGDNSVEVASDSSTTTFNGQSLKSGTNVFSDGGKRFVVTSILDEKQCRGNKKALDSMSPNAPLYMEETGPGNCP